MNNICGVCGNEKRYDEYHRLYRRCDSCNSKHALKYYYNNKDKVLAEKRNFYHNNKEYFAKYNNKRQSRITDLENQVKQLTEMLKSTTLVA